MFPHEALRVSSENFCIIQPVLICSRFFGLCPVRYKNCGHFFTLEWSCAYQIYSVAIPLLLGSITLFSLVDDVDVKVESERDLKRRYLSACDIFTITLIVLFCILATPRKLKSFWKICENFNEIEEHLIIKNPRSHRKASISFIISVLLSYSTVYILDIIAWHTNYERIDGMFILLIDYIPFYMLKYIMLNEILFFCHMIYFTSIRITYLNQSLQRITTQRIFGLSRFHNGEINVIPPSLTYNMKINDTALRVNELIKVHRSLFQVTHVINTTGEFGIQVIILSILLHLVVSPYFLFSELEKGEKASMIFVALQTMWIMAHVGKFFIILETSQQCISEADTLFLNVQKLFAKESVVKTKKALLTLIMQLKICKTEINVIGLFKLDRFLVTGFVASITTYLVVLLQVD